VVPAASWGAAAAPSPSALAHAGEGKGRKASGSVGVAHPGGMEPDPSLLDPGRMTVPPLFGWEHIVLVLVLVAAVGVAFLLHSVARGSVHERADWQSWLEARSNRPSGPGAGVPDPGAERIHPSRLVRPSPQDGAETATHRR